MASFETRNHRSGTTYRVKWREAGEWRSATFTEKATARRFKADVEMYDNRWPEHGWLRDGAFVRPLTQADVTQREESRAPTEEEVPVAVTVATPFLAFAAEYVRDKTGIGADTRTRYANQVIEFADELDAIVAKDTATPDDAATIENLTSRHVSRWINARQNRGASPKTIRNWHGLLFQVLQAAVNEGLRSMNPCVSTGRALPRRDAAHTSDTKVFLTHEEFALIADAMWPGLPDPGRNGEVVAIGTKEDRDLIVAAVGIGARWGELTALLVQDVELVPIPRVRIERAWKSNGVGEYARLDVDKRYLGPPKTVKGRRRVRVGQSVAELLKTRIAAKPADAFVFSAPTGGPVNQRTFYRFRWLKAVALARRNGLTKSPRFHDLRHTYAAWLISAGVPLPEVQQRLGHESIQTTVDVYGGLLEVAGDLADQAIDAALDGGARAAA